MKGEYKVGYEVNKKTYFHLVGGKGSIFGAYECSFNKRSTLVYHSTSKEPVTGFFIRKKIWLSLF